MLGLTGICVSLRSLLLDQRLVRTSLSARIAGLGRKRQLITSESSSNPKRRILLTIRVGGPTCYRRTDWRNFEG